MRQLTVMFRLIKEVITRVYAVTTGRRKLASVTYSQDFTIYERQACAALYLAHIISVEFITRTINHFYNFCKTFLCYEKLTDVNARIAHVNFVLDINVAYSDMDECIFFSRSAMQSKFKLSRYTWISYGTRVIVNKIV